MEDLNALYKALEKAHNAGDTESARSLTKYIKSLPAEPGEAPVSTEPVDVTKPPQDLTQIQPQEDSSDFIRGMRTYFPETKATLSGAEALLGKQIGSEKLVRAGVKGYEEASKELAPLAKETDTIQGAIDKGVGAVVTDFLPYWAGKGVGMLGEGLAFSAVGSLLGSAVPGAGTAGGAITGFVSKSLVKKGLKEAVEKIAKEKGDDAAKAFIEKEATKFMASEAGQTAIKKEIGKRVGIGAMAGIHGEGEVMSQAIDHATQTITDPEEKIKAVEDLSTGRLTTAAAGHALGDYFATKIGLDALDNLAGPTKNFIMSVVKNWAVTGAKEVPPELLQTALERFGAEMPLADKEAINDYINTAAASFGMAAVPGAYGGVKGAIQARKEAEVTKDIDTSKDVDKVEGTTEEKRGSRKTIINNTISDLEEKANKINEAKKVDEAKLKAAQQQQVISEAADLESTLPEQPSIITPTTLTSWGIRKGSNAYKALEGVDAATPEGRDLMEKTLEANKGKINEQAVETFTKILDQKAEAPSAGLDFGTTRISDAVSGGQYYGSPGGTQGRFGPTTNISGSITGIPEEGKGAGNAPLEEGAPEEVVTKEAEAPTSTEVLKSEEELTPVSTQPKVANQLRALDPANPLIEALQNDQASEEELATAQNTVKELQAARKAKQVDLTKVSEEEKGLPQEARGEIQDTNETPESIEAAFQKQYGKNVKLAKQRKLINFLNDVSELPPEVGPVTPGTKAVFHEGKAYFITNRITKEDAPRMLLHEIGAHYGLEGMLGTANYKRIVRALKQKHLTDKDIKAAWENTLETYPELPENGEYFIQEVIANLGESAPNNTLFRQIMGYIKQFLSRLGYGWNVDKITADDIRDMVQHSVRVSLAGKIKGTQPGITLAGTETKPTFFSQLRKAILEHPMKDMKAMPAEQWRMWLIKNAPKKGIKEEELEYSKIKEYLDSLPSKTKISREELYNWVGANLPEVKAVQLGGIESLEKQEMLKERALSRQIGIDNFGIAIKNLRQALINAIPNARYEDRLFDLPSGFTIVENPEGGFDVLTPEGQRIASGDTAEEAKVWALEDVLNRRQLRERDGKRVYIGPEDGVDIDKIVNYILQDVNDVSESDNVDNTSDFEERMNALDVAAKNAYKELDELWGAHYQMRSSQDEFNRAIEETNEDARFTRFTLPGNREGEVNFAMVFDTDGNLVYTAPQVHSMGAAGDKNRIVHIRGNIRTNINGDRVFFVEEIQSDWGQKAYDLRQQAIKNLKNLGFSEENAKKAIPTDYGFKKPLTQEEQNKLQAMLESLDRLDEEISNLDSYMDRIVEGREALIASNEGQYESPEFKQRLKDSLDVAEKARIKRNDLKAKFQELKTEANELKKRDYDKLPRGPYVADTKAWITLALKQIFRYATDLGLNKVMFVNGQQSADRYNLSQVIDNIKWSRAGREEDVYTVEGYKNGEKVWSSYHATPNEIVENMGQQVLDQIREEEYKLKQDPIRQRLVELKSEYLKWRYDINEAKKDLVQHGMNNGWTNSDIRTLLESISSFSNQDQKDYLIDNLLGAGVRDPVFGKLAVKNYINALNKFDAAYDEYSSQMKLHGLEDANNPIASSINVKDMELNAEGKGMKEFYDSIVPQALRDYLKKIGGGEIINLPILDFTPGDANINQLQVTLSPKAVETVSQPQPLFARASKRDLDDTLRKSGVKTGTKVVQPTTFDRFKAQPLQTTGELINDFRRNFFSFDTSINAKILSAMVKRGVSQVEYAKAYIQMQISQAVKSDQLADLFLMHGDIDYDNESLKFVVSDARDSMIYIRNKLKDLAGKYNVSEADMYQYGSAAFIARRSKSLVEANKALKKRVLKLLVAGKKAQAKREMDNNFKLVHLTQDEIREGESFFTKIPELERIYNAWNSNRRRVLNFAEKQGLISQEEKEDLLDLMDYVPFYREAQVEEGAAVKEFTRGLLDTAKQKRLKGSYQPVNNVFDNMERWTRYTVRKAVNNRAAQEKIRLYSQWIPSDIRVVPAKETRVKNTVSVWQNGKLTRYAFQGYDGHAMVQGFTGIEPVMLPFFGQKVMRPFAGFLRLNIVLQPIFNIAQISMDTLTTPFTTGIKNPFAIPLQVLKEIVLTPLHKSEARAYLKRTGTVGKHDFSSEYERIDIEAMNEIGKLNTTTEILKAFAKPFKFLAMASDNVVRQAVYAQILKETGDKARAVHVAEEVINFRRTGSSGFVNVMRQVSPFVNANLQSLNISFGTLLGRGITPDFNNVAYKRFMLNATQMMGVALLFAALNADDDDYNKMDPAERDRSLVIPGSGGFKLPMRMDIFTLLFKVFPEHLYNRLIAESEDSEKLKLAMSRGFKRAITVPYPTTTLFTPFIERAINVDLNTGRPLIGQGQANLEEDLQYSNKYTLQLSRAIGDAGGVSPITVQHFLDRYFGTTTMLFGLLTNNIVGAMRNEILPDKSIKELLLQIPNASMFLSKENGARNINDYYELNDITSRIIQSASRYEGQDYDKYLEYLEKDYNSEIIQMKKELNEISQALENYRKYENQVYSSKDTRLWTPETKRAELERINKERDEMLGYQLELEAKKDRYIQQLRYRAGL